MDHIGIIALILAAYATLEWVVYEAWHWKANGRFPPGECCRRFWNYYIKGRNYDGTRRP